MSGERARRRALGNGVSDVTDVTDITRRRAVGDGVSRRHSPPTNGRPAVEHPGKVGRVAQRAGHVAGHVAGRGSTGTRRTGRGSTARAGRGSTEGPRVNGEGPAEPAEPAAFQPPLSSLLVSAQPPLAALLRAREREERPQPSLGFEILVDAELQARCTYRYAAVKPSLRCCYAIVTPCRGYHRVIIATPVPAVTAVTAVTTLTTLTILTILTTLTVTLTQVVLLGRLRSTPRTTYCCACRRRTAAS